MLTLLLPSLRLTRLAIHLSKKHQVKAHSPAQLAEYAHSSLSKMYGISRLRDQISKSSGHSHATSETHYIIGISVEAFSAVSSTLRQLLLK